MNSISWIIATKIVILHLFFSPIGDEIHLGTRRTSNMYFKSYCGAGVLRGERGVRTDHPRRGQDHHLKQTVSAIQVCKSNRLTDRLTDWLNDWTTDWLTDWLTRSGSGKNAVPVVWLHDYHLMLAANTIRDTAIEEGFSIRYLKLKGTNYDFFKIWQ